LRRGETAQAQQLTGQAMVQPVWRFTGSFEDGRTFEIQIQAIAEEYLR
jgi:hypothetical protein